MRTPKIHALWKLIDWLNLKNDLNILKKPLNTSSLDSDAWLSGFIEADGHFSIRTTITSKYSKIECKFELSQRQKDHKNYDNLFFLEAIANVFQCQVKPIRMNTPNPQYRIRTTNLNSNLIVLNYFKNFPLFGSKFLDLQD